MGVCTAFMMYATTSHSNNNINPVLSKLLVVCSFIAWPIVILALAISAAIMRYKETKLNEQENSDTDSSHIDISEDNISSSEN